MTTQGSRGIGGITTGSIIVIVGIIVAILWSVILGVIIALIGLVAFGGFARAGGTERPRAGAGNRLGATEFGYPSSVAMVWGGIGLGGIAVMLVIDILVARAL